MLVASTVERQAEESRSARPIDDETIEQLLEAAGEALPSGPAATSMFVVVQDQRTIARCSSLVKAVLLEHARVYAKLESAWRAPRQSPFFAALNRPDFNVFHGAATLVLVCSRSSNPFAAADAWMAAERLMAHASAAGHVVTCVGSATAALNAPILKRDLGIPADVTVVAPITIVA
jgi:hypothetical protein